MIINHPVMRIASPSGYDDPAKVCQCDFCKVICKGYAVDAGLASEEARKFGWETRKPKSFGDPKRWICSTCVANEFK